VPHTNTADGLLHMCSADLFEQTVQCSGLGNVTANLKCRSLRNGDAVLRQLRSTVCTVVQPCCHIYEHVNIHIHKRHALRSCAVHQCMHLCLPGCRLVLRLLSC
jgi:hypothetical protein